MNSEVLPADLKEARNNNGQALLVNSVVLPPDLKETFLNYNAVHHVLFS